MRTPSPLALRRLWPLLALAVLLVGVLAYRGLAGADDGGIRLPAGVEPVTFGKGVATLTGRNARLELRVEVADTPERQQRGLMYRTRVPDDTGMVFVYERPDTGGFWMKNTLVPLTIAFFDERGVIRDILDMAPCVGRGDDCPTYTPRNPYVGALEVRQGLLREKGLREGDSVSLRREE